MSAVVSIANLSNSMLVNGLQVEAHTLKNGTIQNCLCKKFEVDGRILAFFFLFSWVLKRRKPLFITQWGNLQLTL